MLESLRHHAYAISGAPEEITLGLLKSLEETEDIRTRGNPDVRSLSYQVMGIEEARMLKEAAGRRALSGDNKIFIVSARGITKEAQNALLKVFEEPPLGTHFFLIVPSLDILLPTLQSRVYLLSSLSRAHLPPTPALAPAFLGETTAKRLEIIRDLLAVAAKESEKQVLIDFLDALARGLAEGKSDARAAALHELFLVKKYSRDRAPSFKLLLEHLALVLPQT